MANQRPKVNVVNLTGHAISFSVDGYRFLSQGKARVKPHYENVATIRMLDNGFDTKVDIPVVYISDNEVQGLPPPQENTLYVVSGLVEAAVRRPDVVAPGRLHKDRGVVRYARALLQHERWNGP